MATTKREQAFYVLEFTRTHMLLVFKGTLKRISGNILLIGITELGEGGSLKQLCTGYFVCQE